MRQVVYVNQYSLIFSDCNIIVLGNVYIADYNNHRIRKVTVSTGIISTIAGTGTAEYSGDNEAATNAGLYYPIGVALDSKGISSITFNYVDIVVSSNSYCKCLLGNVYIADSYNQRIRKVTISSEIITTIAGCSTSFASVFTGGYAGGYSGDGGQASSALLDYPYGVALDSAGNTSYLFHAAIL